MLLRFAAPCSDVWPKRRPNSCTGAFKVVSPASVSTLLVIVPAGDQIPSASVATGAGGAAAARAAGAAAAAGAGAVETAEGAVLATLHPQKTPSDLLFKSWEFWPAL